MPSSRAAQCAIRRWRATTGGRSITPPAPRCSTSASLTEFAFRLARGKIAINLDEGDALVGVALTDGERAALSASLVEDVVG